MNKILNKLEIFDKNYWLLMQGKITLDEYQEIQFPHMLDEIKQELKKLEKIEMKIDEVEKQTKFEQLYYSHTDFYYDIKSIKE